MIWTGQRDAASSTHPFRLPGTSPSEISPFTRNISLTWLKLSSPFSSNTSGHVSQQVLHAVHSSRLILTWIMLFHLGKSRKRPAKGSSRIVPVQFHKIFSCLFSRFFIFISQSFFPGMMSPCIQGSCSPLPPSGQMACASRTTAPAAGHSPSSTEMTEGSCALIHGSSGTSKTPEM